MYRRSFRAMGTTMELFLESADTPDELLAESERELRRLEALLSRFRPDSELSRLNRERSLEAGPELAELVGLALEARERTGGRFDPTVHDAVVVAGYDRSFELVARDAGSPVGVMAARCAGHVTLEGRRVTLEDGFNLDLGGIAKGWAADRALAVISEAGPALVDAGGDVVGAGTPWPIGVVTARGTVTLELTEGALATSGRDRRRWWRDGHEAHHLIDPRTAEPADSDVLTVTAFAPTAAEAEVRATALFLAEDADAAAAEADAEDLAAVVVTRDGRTLLAGGLT